MSGKKTMSNGPTATILPEEEESRNNIVPFKNSRSRKPPSLVPELAMSMSDARKRIASLKKFVDEMLTPGIDYGLVSGNDKCVLLKPGAEKLCDAFGFSKRVVVTNRVEDWRIGLFHYEVRVTLICKRTGLIEAEGIGSCNSREERFRNERGYDMVNTIQKLAKKRSLIDAILSATRSSDLFTQDIEEMPWLCNLSKGKDTSEKASGKQLGYIFSLAAKKKISTNRAKEMLQGRYSVSASKLLSASQASDFINYLKELKMDNEQK